MARHNASSVWTGAPADVRYEGCDVVHADYWDKQYGPRCYGELNADVLLDDQVTVGLVGGDDLVKIFPAAIVNIDNILEWILRRFKFEGDCAIPDGMPTLEAFLG